MNDEEKRALARQGLRAAELLEPGKLKADIKESVSEAVGDAALRGLAAVGRLRGGGEVERSPARARAAEAVDIGDALASWDRDDEAEFEARLRRATAQQAQVSANAQQHLADLRRSFPEPARNLALLLFNCVDVLEEIADDVGGVPPASPALARKEELLLRIAALLEPQAGAALQAFVDHVVQLSRQHRARPPE